MNKRSVLALFVILFWILFVLIGYYYYHKPINLAMTLAPLSGLVDLLFVFLFAGLSGGLGRRLLPAEAVPNLERAVLQFALGMGLISFLWLIFGVLGLYHLPLGWLVLLIGLGVLFRDVRGWYGSFGGLKDIWKRSGTFERILGLFCAVMVLYQLFTALAPPIKWDALTYHLELPRQFLNAGSLAFIPYNYYWGHPLLVEMIYTFAMSIHGPTAAAVTGWGVGALVLVGVFGFTNTQVSLMQGQEVEGGSAGWMAVTALLVGETFRHMFAWSYTDLFSALYGLVALITFFTWLDLKKDRWLLWTGVFSGFAIGTKLTSGVLFLGFALVLFWYRRALRFSWKTVLLAGLLAFLVTSPWLIKNLVVTGSPLYPYFIPTTWLDAARLASANERTSPAIWWYYLLLPISTTWTGDEGTLGFSADLGPLLLLFALPGYWLGRCHLKTRILAVMLIPAAISLGILSHRFLFLDQTRLYYVLLPAVAAVCGWGWNALRPMVLENVRVRRILSAAVMLVVVLVFWKDSYWFSRISPDNVFIGWQSKETYLEMTLGDYTQAIEAVNQLPADAHILFLWEPRGYYAPLNTQPDLWIDRWRTDRRELGNADAILQRWHGQGFTHMLLFGRGLELIRPAAGEQPSENWKVWEEMVESLPQPQVFGDTNDSYYLYELNAE